MKNFFKGFAKALGIVQQISAFVPVVPAPVNKLLTLAKNAVNIAEIRRGGGTGPEKKADVLSTIAAAAPELLELAESITGRDLVENEAFAEACAELVDAEVAVQKAVAKLTASIVAMKGAQ